MSCENGVHEVVERTTPMDRVLYRRVSVCACGQASTVKTDEYACNQAPRSERITA